MAQDRHQAFAIVRIDEFQDESVAMENRVTVKQIVWSESEARAEVDRLNRLNAQKGCRYFWQTTRVSSAREEGEGELDQKPS